MPDSVPPGIRLPLPEVFVGHLQVVLGRTGSLLPIHLQTTCIGKRSASSVSRVLRRFWKGFGQGSSPALRMIRSNWVRRLEFESRYRVMTYSVPGFGLLESLFQVGPQLGEHRDHSGFASHVVLGLRAVNANPAPLPIHVAPAEGKMLGGAP